MSGSVRARKSSPPPVSQSIDLNMPHQTKERFPRPPQGFPDAETKRYSASVISEADPRRYAPAPGLTTKSTKGGLHMITSGEWKLLVLIVIVAAGVRLFRLSKPDSVVFDEVHFGKFASKYIKTQYFVDVHPPLAKLLITLAAFIFGYDGNFDFKDIAKSYVGEGVPYVAMRLVPALCGVATIPVAYLTLRLLDCRVTTALLGAMILTFDNALTTQSRLILLDAPLVLFTSLSLYFWVLFSTYDKHRQKWFSEEWYSALMGTGLSLGAVLSCKWVGLFTYATVGVSTVMQLWFLLGDLRVSMKVWVKHFWYRAVCLIGVPLLFYMAMFQIHFMILNSSGDGDGFMSAEFQHTLGGRAMRDTNADIAISSIVTIRHKNTQGGYLHSHPHNYPGGSKQQQITLYPHRDSNNEWRILNATSQNPEGQDSIVQFIYPGARIKLQHTTTEKHLHSHDIRPPVSDVEFQNEVSAYGMPGFSGDANDDWFVEIHTGSKGDKESHKRLRTLRTEFRLRHALSGCYLFSHKVKLPEWGWEQQEVTCNKNAVRDNSIWFIETSEGGHVPADSPKVNYKYMSFFKKFWELQQVMWTTNAGLTDRHTYDSRPDSWPRLRRGINFWVKDHKHIYLIGNPFVWWMSSLGIVAFLATGAAIVVGRQRGLIEPGSGSSLGLGFGALGINFGSGSGGGVKSDAAMMLFVGWVLHYGPFWIMGRQLFLHHYLPALYFAVLLAVVGWDALVGGLRPRIRLQIAAAILVIVIYGFVHWSPLIYGSEWTKKECANAKWLKTWDFSCNELYDSYSQYHTVPTKVATTVPTASTVAHNADGNTNDENTSIIQGQLPAPGRDIFAEKAENVHVKASMAGEKMRIVEDDAEESEIKQISTVVEAAAEKTDTAVAGEGSFQIQTSPAENAAADAEKEAAVEGLDDVHDVAQSTQKTVVVEQVVGKEPEKEREQGPLGELEAEADKVAKELYPEDVD